eukprot:SAG22_NODE_700_length_7794_cov_27.105263_2_plen_662_part_00
MVRTRPCAAAAATSRPHAAAAAALLSVLVALDLLQPVHGQCEAPFFTEQPEFDDPLFASIVLVEASAGDAAENVRHGCTQPSAVNFDAAAELDNLGCIARVHGCSDLLAINYDGSANTDSGECVYAEGVRPCAQFNCTASYCFELLDAAYLACSASTCGAECHSAAENATALGGHCGPAVVTEGPGSFVELVRVLQAGIAAVDCSAVLEAPTTVMVTMTAAATLTGYVSSAAFQAAIEHALAVAGSSGAAAPVVTVTFFEQRVESAMVLPGSTMDYDPESESGALARRQFIAGIVQVLDDGSGAAAVTVTITSVVLSPAAAADSSSSSGRRRLAELNDFAATGDGGGSGGGRNGSNTTSLPEGGVRGGVEIAFRIISSYDVSAVLQAEAFVGQFVEAVGNVPLDPNGSSSSSSSSSRIDPAAAAAAAAGMQLSKPPAYRTRIVYTVTMPQVRARERERRESVCVCAAGHPAAVEIPAVCLQLRAQHLLHGVFNTCCTACRTGSRTATTRRPATPTCSPRSSPTAPRSPPQSRRAAGGCLRRCRVSRKALSFCCASTVFLSKTVPFRAVRPAAVALVEPVVVVETGHGCTAGHAYNRSLSGCARCGNGTVSNGTAPCAACQPGTAPDAEQRSCSRCGAGQVSVDGTACTECGGGTVRQRSCF